MSDQSAVNMDTKDLPGELPILPLFDAVLFPKMVLPLVVMQKESVDLVDEAMHNDRILGLVLAKGTVKNEDPDNELHKLGTSALILKMASQKRTRPS